ncbi:MAG TPA: thermonuclease family protein [Pseudobacteroides sp.]|uniref:thermonuclease family protein n=1 Tax=Pseudobacteroides sp. TaxID=1968840 RepID=UPI002F91D503
MNNDKVRFYNKPWFMWVMLILFAPVGLILLWKNKRYNTPARFILTFVFSAVFLFVVIPSDNKNTQNNISSRDNTRNEPIKTLPANQGNTPTPLPTDTNTAKTGFAAVQVIRAVDGDTIEASFLNGSTEKIRLIGVNTPESTTRHEPYGSEASNFTKKSLAGKTVYIEKDVSERDKYGRLLRIVWLENPVEITETNIRSKMFNAILVLKGYAQASTYPPDVKYSEYFTKFAKEAREANVGLWSLNGTNKTPVPQSTLKPSQTNSPTVKPTAVKPTAVKPTAPGQPNGKIKGNISSSGEKIYHVPGGAFYDKTIAEEYFDTEAQAQAAGYRRSKR